MRDATSNRPAECIIYYVMTCDAHTPFDPRAINLTDVMFRSVFPCFFD
jgi:hypothetical protein